MKKYSQRWKVDGKFATFKDFIKKNGSDYVTYSNLTTTEKKILNAVEQYKTRLVIDGKFRDNKNLINNPTLKMFAKNKGMDIKDYIKANYKTITNYQKKGVLTYSVNLQKLPEFITKHAGTMINNDGEIMTKSEMLEYLTTLIKTAMKGTKYFTAFVTFYVKNFGSEITPFFIKLIGSNGTEEIKL